MLILWSLIKSIAAHLNNAKTRRIVGFVSQRDVGRQVTGFKPVLEFAMQDDDWLARLRLPRWHLADFAGAPGHRHRHAQAYGFAEGFLGAEPRGQIPYAAFGPTQAARTPGGQFGITQDFLGKPVAMAPQTFADAPDVADVGSYSVDQAWLPCSIQARYDLTVAV